MLKSCWSFDDVILLVSTAHRAHCPRRCKNACTKISGAHFCHALNIWFPCFSVCPPPAVNVGQADLLSNERNSTNYNFSAHLETRYVRVSVSRLAFLEDWCETANLRKLIFLCVLCFAFLCRKSFFRLS